MKRLWRRFFYWWVGDTGSPWVHLKWRLTHWLIDDARRPRMDRCWATSISWALGLDSLEGALGSSSTKCREDAARDGYCYCCRFACRETLLGIGADPGELHPDEWVKP
jgi:hypothetical protein